MNQKSTFIGIIPARYASTRFPGKPLADLGGKPVIQHVVEQARKALDRVVVATDDQRIFDAVTAFGGEAVMTSPDHSCGTDRVLEAFQKLGAPADIVINIQGDEPFIAPEQICALKSCFDIHATDIATLARRFDPANGFEALFDANLVKVVFGKDGRALYFSRSIVPYVRGAEWKQWLDKAVFHTHVGIYAYRAEVLGEITKLERSPLEIAESLEQLRWLENGYNIRVALTEMSTVGIDTPADLEAARAILNSRS